MEYEVVIGMEIHFEIKTASKMFCSCANNPEEVIPNKNVCPICAGHPGTLPTINKKAIESVIRAGLAVNCEIATFSKFDRKNYFYPDLPKGYQVTQYDLPLCKNGFLEVNGKKIRVNRIHMEEDTGKLVHPAGAGYSLVDLNRSSVPLAELVTEADLRSSADAKDFCKQLQQIIRAIGVSDGDMEKGHMRCEANISLRPVGREEFGTKVEVKNLNSFRAVERAIEYEMKRQAEVLNEGGKIVQETRGWNADKQITFSQRLKEEAHDYRYFPEPDLPPMDLTKEAGVFDVEAIKNSIPELPMQKKYRLMDQYGLTEENAKIFSEDYDLSNAFEEVVSELEAWVEAKDIDNGAILKLTKLSANYILTEMQRLLYVSGTTVCNCKISKENFAEFITLIYEGKVSSSGAQALLKEMFDTGGDPSDILDAKGLGQMTDGDEIGKIVDAVIVSNQKSVDDYKGGKENALKFLIGQVMRESKGQANPNMAEELLKKKLG
ncbi:MAG: Asp-tRNA(Asn)/Glu-tRNA(Gln) amidotransferase subunit GatB [Candidatus Pacebacteria bacterium]|nr:Asp-tRNA(Asn)/Glu-tRNA(Gln) amidotransferase subunit GatB [Candidatus Paceibacterota bacterium]